MPYVQLVSCLYMLTLYCLSVGRECDGQTLTPLGTTGQRTVVDCVSKPGDMFIASL